jgi:hypothetical protein
MRLFTSGSMLGFWLGFWLGAREQPKVIDGSVRVVYFNLRRVSLVAMGVIPLTSPDRLKPNRERFHFGEHGRFDTEH